MINNSYKWDAGARKEVTLGFVARNHKLELYLENLGTKGHLHSCVNGSEKLEDYLLQR